MWIPFRELILQIFLNPWMWLPILSIIVLLLASQGSLTWLNRGLIASGIVLLASCLYSPVATTLLSNWLTSQLPANFPRLAPQAVLLGRGEVIASATTEFAAGLEKNGLITDIYVSGDRRETAEHLVALGVPPERVAGDSCARTTFENAKTTVCWLRKTKGKKEMTTGRPSAITLITDQWQLPRATLVFNHAGVDVKPVSAPVVISQKEKNRLALRETMAMILYRLQARI